jgi:MFS family permease
MALDRAQSRADSIRLRSALLVSTTGDWIYRFAVPTLILAVTGSALSTAFAYVLEYIPYIVVGMVSGVVADRWDRRRIMVVCDSMSFVLALVIAGISLRHPPVVALYVCAFALACVRPFYFPAFQGLLVDTVPSEQRSRMNAWTQTVDSGLNLIGPVIGTAIVAAVGVSSATLINAVSFAMSALLVYQIRYGRSTVQAAEDAASMRQISRDLLVGLRTLWQIKPIRYGTLLGTAANMAGYFVEGNLIYLGLHVEHLPKVALGLVFSVQGLGALLGAAIAPRLVDRYPTGWLFTLGMGGSGVAMLVPAFLPYWWAVVFSWGLEAVATSIIVVSWFTIRQHVVPAAVTGRVAAVSRALAFAAIPLGAVLGGLLVSTASPIRTVFGWAAALQLLVFVGTARSPVTQCDVRETAAEAEAPVAAATVAQGGPPVLDSAPDG